MLRVNTYLTKVKIHLLSLTVLQYNTMGDFSSLLYLYAGIYIQIKNFVFPILNFTVFVQRLRSPPWTYKSKILFFCLFFFFILYPISRLPIS